MNTMNNSQKYRFRHELIQSILSNSSSASQDYVWASMIRCFQGFVDIIEAEKETNDHPSTSSIPCEEGDETVSPLMIACEQCQVDVIRFLSTQLKESDLKDKSVLQQGIIKFNNPSILIELFGHPLDSLDPKVYGGNGPAHFIAASKKRNTTETFDALVLLLELIMLDDELKEENRERLAKISVTRPLLSSLSTTSLTQLLLFQKNANNDTPIMMASAKGNIEFLRHVIFPNDNTISVAHKEEESHYEYIRKILRMQNNKGDTALKLAFGYGYYDILQLFINGNKSTTKNENSTKHRPDNQIVKITGDDVKECQFILSNVEETLAEIRANKVTNIKKVEKEDWYSKLRDMKKCFILIRLTAEQNARLMEEELISLTEKEIEKAKDNKKRPQKKKKKKRNARQKKDSDGGNSPKWTGISNEMDDDQKDDMKGNDTKADHELKPITSPHFVTLDDGTMVGTSVSKNLNSGTIQAIDQTKANESVLSSDMGALPSKPNTSIEKKIITNKDKLRNIEDVNDLSTLSSTTLQTMLRDRFRETINDHNYKPSKAENGELEQLMNSLCLDVSMLLLSPHGMAMSLSPCQLDAVGQLLQDQLDAVTEARQIQDRLRQKNDEKT